MVVRLSDIRSKTGKKFIFGSRVARMGQNFDDCPGFQHMKSWANTYAVVIR